MTIISNVRRNIAQHTLITIAVLLITAIFLQGCSSQSALAEGDQAPMFSLPASTGSELALSDVINDRPALLYFHMANG